MPVVYVGVELTKDGKTVVTTSNAEEAQLRWDGWTPTSWPDPPHDQDIVRVTDLDDPNSPARKALGPLGGAAPTTDAAKEGYVPSRLSAPAVGAAFVAGNVYNSDGSRNTAKTLHVVLTADGSDIQDLVIV